MPRRRLGLTSLLAITLGTLTSAQSAPVVEQTGLRGTVLTHEDAPATAGTVALQSAESPSAVSVAIERDGRFRSVLSTAGLHRLTITVPGFAPHRVNVIVPPSRNIALPAIRLTAPTYLRARFVTAAGEAISLPYVRRRFLGADGMATGGVEVSADTDGAVLVGPLPRGVNALAVDVAMLAVTPVGELTVTGDDRIVEGGTITVQPGTVLHVDAIDGTGAPVPNHLTSLEPATPFSALTPRSARTNQQGRATFDRLAAGSYRVNMTAIDPCNRSLLLSMSRLVRVNGTGEVREQIELDGVVRLYVESPYGPLAGVAVSVAPDSGENIVTLQRSVPGRLFRPFAAAARCSGTTDADGRVAFTNVPPGPILIDIRMGNSTHRRRATVRSSGPALAIKIPDAFLQVQVTNESTGRPVSNASITWSGGGYRVQSTSNGNGAALLEGVGDGAGPIEVTASGFAADGAKVTITQSGIHEVTLRPDSPSQRRVRVVGPTGQPVPGAIVELLPPTVLDVGVIAVTDAKGAVVFPNAPPGALSAIASADGFAPVSFSLAGDTDAPVVVTLAPLR